MTYKIKLISDEVEGFLREIEIDSDATFRDLCRAIHASCGYADDLITSFYICDEDWRRHAQVMSEDLGMGSSDEDIYLMADTPLSELIEDEGQRMEYVFDPFYERLFFMTVTDTLPGRHIDKPEVVTAHGDAPKQIAEEDTAVPTKGAKATGIEAYDDTYDTEGFDYNDDELDMEGFEITDGSNI